MHSYLLIFDTLRAAAQILSDHGSQSGYGRSDTGVAIAGGVGIIAGFLILMLSAQFSSL